jgi:hypothetical protein
MDLQFIVESEGTGWWDVSGLVRRFQFGTRTPGGFWEARVMLDAAARDIWQYYHGWPGGTLTVRAVGLLVWEGDLAGFRSLEPLTLVARGEVLRLRGPELWRAYADASFASWEPVRTDSMTFNVDNNNRLYVEAVSSVVYEAGDEGQVTYPEDLVLGAGITYFEAHALIVLRYGPWIVEVRDDAGSVLWSTTSSVETDVAVAVSSASGLIFALRATVDAELTPPAPVTDLAGAGAGALSNGAYKYVVTFVDANGESAPSNSSRITVSDAGSDGQVSVTEIPTGYSGTTARRLYRTKADGSTYYYLTEIADNTTTTYTDNVADGSLGAELSTETTSARLTQVVVRTLHPTYSESVVEDVLDLKSIASFDVQATGLTLDSAVWQGEKALKALEDVVELGDGAFPWVFVVYEHGAIFRAWATEADWVLLPEDVGGRWKLQLDRDDVRNAVRAQLPDNTFTAWQTDDDSIALYGRHEATIDVPQTSQAEAVRYAQVYLESHADPLSSIEADAGATIHKPDLTPWPAYLVRAGDVITVRDIVPGEDLSVRVKETTFDGKRLRLIPVGSDNRLEIILAALERQAKG